MRKPGFYNLLLATIVTLTPAAVDTEALFAAYANPHQTSSTLPPENRSKANDNSFENIDHTRLTEKLQNDLTASGLPLPENLNLFPEDLDFSRRISHNFNRWLGNIVIKKSMAAKTSEGKVENNSVTGIANNGSVRDIAKSMLEEPPYSGSCDNSLTQNFEAFRTMVALHELSHYIDAKLGLTNSIVKNIKQNTTYDGHADDLDLQMNIKERIADASFALYALSNHGGSPLIEQVVDWRQANLEKVHFTSSTVSLAVAAYHKAPVKGMSIVETTKMAAEIVSNQPKLWNELDRIGQAQLEMTKIMPAVSGDKSNILHDEIEYAEIKKVEATALAARGRLCGRIFTPNHPT